MTLRREPDTALGEYILPLSSIRFVLLHYHIFKNAGSTIEFVLKRAFGQRFATLHGADPNSINSGSDMAAFLLSQPGVAAISSHHLKYPKPALPGLVVFDLCLLRDPLERLASMYKHFRRSPAMDEISARAKQMDLRSFFDLLIQEHPHMVNNVQVNILANASAYTRPPDSTDLAAALHIVRESSAIGVVDLFDQSMVAAEYFLRPAFPALRLEYVRQNASNNGDAAAAPDSQFRDALGPVVFVQLQKMNQLDSELVSRARDEVRRRFELMPSPEERLIDFRGRCAELRAKASRNPAPQANVAE
jgi:hypothetical protein